jgi:hypothetical protein
VRAVEKSIFSGFLKSPRLVVSRDHQRDILRIENRHFQDHGILAQVKHAADIERVVVGACNLPHRVVFELGIGLTGVPSTLLEREFVVHVVHGHVLVGAADEVLDLSVAERDFFSLCSPSKHKTNQHCRYSGQASHGVWLHVHAESSLCLYEIRLTYGLLVSVYVFS